MLWQALLFAPPMYAVVAVLIHYFNPTFIHPFSGEVGRTMFYVLLPVTIALAVTAKHFTALILSKRPENVTAPQKQARFILECVYIEAGAILGLVLFLASGLLAEGFLLMAIAWSGLWLHKPE